MKRILSLILSVLMLVSAVSCRKIDPLISDEETSDTTVEKTEEVSSNKKSDPEEPVALKVGFSRQKFTPKGSVPLGGYAAAAKRLSKSVKNDVCATCIAFTDGVGRTFLMFTLDLLSIPDSLTEKAKTTVHQVTGVPVSNISFSCTHTHEAPLTTSSDTASENWKTNEFTVALKDAAKSALEDLDDTEIYQVTDTLKNLTFSRRFKNSDGTYASAGDSKNKVVDYEFPNFDESLQVIKFDRAENKDIILVNWRAHPCHDSSETATVISADYIHYMRQAVEKKGYDCAFFQGAAGNMITSCKLPTTNKKYVPTKENAEVYGEALADGVIKALGKLNKADIGNIRVMSKRVTLTIDHSEDGKYSKAKEVYDLVQANKTAEARSLAAKLGFDSMYHASSIVTKKNSGQTATMYVSVLGIGDIAFVFAPYEMFDTNGVQIKKNSPYKNTFICEQSNGSYSYFPSEECFPHRGYEICKFKYVKGTSELIANAFIDLLNEVSK